jgi:hypothetical protein
MEITPSNNTDEEDLGLRIQQNAIREGLVMLAPPGIEGSFLMPRAIGAEVLAEIILF